MIGSFGPSTSVPGRFPGTGGVIVKPSLPPCPGTGGGTNGSGGLVGAGGGGENPGKGGSAPWSIRSCTPW